MKAIGIDISENYSQVAIFGDQQQNAIAEGDQTKPTCITHPGLKTIFGIEESEKQYTSVVHLYGQVLEDIALHAGELTMVKNDNENEPKYGIRYLSGKLLAHMKSMTEVSCEEAGTNAVITVPAHFNELQCRGLQIVGDAAGLNVIRVIDKAVAAVMACDSRMHANESTKVLVVDFEKTFQWASIVSIESGVYSLLATTESDSPFIDSIPNAMKDHLIKKLNKLTKFDLQNDEVAIMNLCEEYKKAKPLLEDNELVIMVIFSPLQERKFYLKLIRDELERIETEVIERGKLKLEPILTKCNLDWKDIVEVITIGVSADVEDILNTLRVIISNVPIKDSIELSKAAVYGATALATKLTRGESQQINNLVFRTFNPLSVGIEMVGGIMYVLVERNTKLPVKEVMYLRAPINKATNMIVKLYEGENVRVSENRLLFKYEISNIPKDQYYKKKIKMVIEILEDDVINLSASLTEEVPTQQTETLKRERYPIEEIVQMVAKGQELKEELKSHRDRIEAMFQLQDCVCERKLWCVNNPKKSETKKLLKCCKQTLKWIEKNPMAPKPQINEMLDKIKKYT